MHIRDNMRSWQLSTRRTYAGSALKHFHEGGDKYPLVVKLGTITPQGADVYSYATDEDDLVLDPLLKQHLAHWGIDMDTMEKTAKTMSELQVPRWLCTLRLHAAATAQQHAPAHRAAGVGLRLCLRSRVLACWVRQS